MTRSGFFGATLIVGITVIIGGANADTVILKNGNTITGEII